MLISISEINSILLQYGIKINGFFHIGAHDCEEMVFYEQMVSNDNIVFAVVESILDENAVFNLSACPYFSKCIFLFGTYSSGKTMGKIWPYRSVNLD